MKRFVFAVAIALLTLQCVFAASVYLTDTPTININESDPIFVVANSTLARVGVCTGGQFVYQTTTGGVVCATPNGTLYYAGVGLLLNGTTFSLNTSYTNGLYDVLGSAAARAGVGLSSICSYGIANITTTTSGVLVTCAAQQGTVTSVVFSGPGLNGGTISSSGTVSLNMTYLSSQFDANGSAAARAGTGSSGICMYGVANITTTTSGIQVTCAAQQGTVTGVTAGSGLTGGTITSSGTIGLNMTFVIANAQALNDSAGVAAVNNTATSALSLATTANGTANGKASPGTCPTGYVTQNTTTSGVQCILASTGSVTNVTAGTGLTGGSITSTGTIALNTTYTGTLYDALGAAAARAGTGVSSVCSYGVANVTATTSGLVVTCAAQQGTVTSITAGTGLTGGTITGSGTVAVNTTYLGTLYDTAGAAALRAATGNCPSGQVVMNTTTSGVQCVVAGTTYTAGTGLTLSGSQFALNTTYTGTLYDALGAAAAVNTSANIQSLGFNNVSQDFVNDSASWYPIASGVSLNATKAFAGVCPSGQFINGTFNSSAPSCAPVTATVPYQSSAAGWANNSQNTTTSLNVNVNLPASINIGGHITAGGPYAMDLVVNNSGSASMAMLNLNPAGFNGIDLYRSDLTLMGGYGYGGTGTGMYTGYYYIDGTAAPIGFFSGGSPRGTLTTGGLWGFGTMNPVTLVDINGTATIRGSLDMNSHQIDNVLDPTAAQDAATKSYVDAELVVSLLGSNQSTTATALSNTTIAMSLAANTNYTIDCNVYFQTAATSTGIGLSLTSNATPTYGAWSAMIHSSSTALQNGAFISLTAGNTVLGTAVAAANTPEPAYVLGDVQVGASSLLVYLQFRSEVAGSSATVIRSSMCEAKRQ